jgi:hypothetical protein
MKIAGQAFCMAALAFSMAACTASSETGGVKSTKASPSRRPPKYIPPPNQPIYRTPSPASTSDGISGMTARELVSRYGQAQQDVREEGARKLQFANQFCIMDAYLYPPAKGKTPVVSYVATRLPDGRSAERNSCLMSLQKR